jgi:hypothetical protein
VVKYGKVREWILQQIDYDPTCAKESYWFEWTEEENIRRQTEGRHLLDWEKVKQLFKDVDAEIANRKTAEMIARLAAANKHFREHDTGLTIPVAHLDRLESILIDQIPQSILDEGNDNLRLKSSPVSFRDIAFVALVHRDSVLNNGKAENRFRNTSPYARITKASTALGYREKPLDNRQVAYCLTLLTALGFTTPIEAAIRGGPIKERRGGKYEIDTAMYAPAFNA